MAIESADFISQLDITFPVGGDQRTTADDHLRLTKKALKQSFPNVSSEVSASAGELNALVGVTSGIQAQLNELSSSYHSAIAVTSANLDAKIDNVSAQLSTTSAALDLKIETLSATLQAAIDAGGGSAAAAIAALSATLSTTSAALSARIITLSANLDTEIAARQTTSANLDAKIEALSATLQAAIDFRGALVYLGVNQVLSAGVTTSILFHDESYDTDTVHDNATNPDRLTVPSGVSKVRLVGQVKFGSDNEVAKRNIRIQKNGGTYHGYAFVPLEFNTAGTDAYLQISTPILSATAGDFFVLAATKASGANASISGDSVGASTWFSMEIHD